MERKNSSKKTKGQKNTKATAATVAKSILASNPAGTNATNPNSQPTSPPVQVEEIVINYADEEDPYDVIMNDPEREFKRNDRTRNTVLSGVDGGSQHD